MKKLNIKNFLSKPWGKLILTVLGIVLVFLLWWVVSLIANNQALFPNPIKVIEIFFNLLLMGDVYIAIGATLLRLLMSFIISFAIAFILGVIGGLFSWFHTLINPLVIVLRTIPTAAVILIMIVLLKPTFALTLIVFLMMFPILYEAIRGGVANTDDAIKQSLRLETNLYSPKSIFKVLIPSAMPTISLGIIQSLGLGMKVSIMAEVLVGNPKVEGLGMMIKNYYNDIQMGYVLALSLFGIILIGLLDYLLHLIKKKIQK